MPAQPQGARPLTFTPNPKLDAALQAGWERWTSAAAAAGAETVTAWLAQRAGDPDLRAAARSTVEALLGAPDVDERASALIELAELAEAAGDDLLADTLWEGLLSLGREAEDPDLLFEATERLAAIAERNGDPLAAAEFYLDFLNWRRQPGHASDAEDVETAFDEIIRLAEQDGARTEAAIYGYRQARFARLEEAEDDRAVEGDWEGDPAPYQSWA